MIISFRQCCSVGDILYGWKVNARSFFRRIAISADFAQPISLVVCAKQSPYSSSRSNSFCFCSSLMLPTIISFLGNLWRVPASCKRQTTSLGLFSSIHGQAFAYASFHLNNISLSARLMTGTITNTFPNTNYCTRYTNSAPSLRS